MVEAMMWTLEQNLKNTSQNNDEKNGN